MSSQHTTSFTITALALLGACSSGDDRPTRTEAVATAATPAAHAAPAALTGSDEVERGRYLVSFAGCHDCHTPFAMGPNGPAPDMSRALSGHPSQMVMPPAPQLPPGPWLVAVAATNTAWSGPWGVSFTSNLTPDRETGLGTWTKQTFIETIRNGRHQGAGRPLLPPMPSVMYAQMTSEDLGAIYAYLRTVPAIPNRVPDPVPPPTAAIAPASTTRLSSK